MPCAKLDEGSPSPRRLISAAGEYLKAAGRGIVFRVSETVGVLRTSPRIDSRLNYLPVAIVSSRVLRDRGSCRYPRTVSSSSMTRYLRTDLCKLSTLVYVSFFLLFLLKNSRFFPSPCRKRFVCGCTRFFFFFISLKISRDRRKFRVIGKADFIPSKYIFISFVNDNDGDYDR